MKNTLLILYKIEHDYPYYIIKKRKNWWFIKYWVEIFKSFSLSETEERYKTINHGVKNIIGK